jgi:hypothetical protein
MRHPITGQPVQGENYPIEIKISKATNRAKKLLPLMQRSVNIACNINKAAGAVSPLIGLFFPAVGAHS